MMNGVPVRIYSAAKTVADCFNPYHKIDIDVATRALREGLQAQRFTREAVWAAAQACRVGAVMRPHLDSL